LFSTKLVQIVHTQIHTHTHIRVLYTPTHTCKARETFKPAAEAAKRRYLVPLKSNYNNCLCCCHSLFHTHTHTYRHNAQVFRVCIAALSGA